jgi:hypothetical protein
MKLYEMINAENWHSPGPAGPGGRRCLAVHMCRHGMIPQSGRVIEAIFVLFPERAPNGSIVDFNDHPATNIDDVLRVLKFADV